MKVYFVTSVVLGACLLPNQNVLSQNACSSDTRERYPWRLWSCNEQEDFLVALERLKESGIYDDFVRTHDWMSEDAHGVAEFLPWHRWFIYEFETALRSVADDPCITLPYWDWEQDAGDELNSIVFREHTFGSLTWENGRSGSCMWQTVRGSCLRRSMDSSFDFFSMSRVVGMIVAYEQYTDDWRSDSERNNGFRAALEGSAHARPHNLIGGNMISMRSPDDPLFYLHHANVDRIWAMWQNRMGQDRMDRQEYAVPEHYEGRWIDSPLSFPSTGDVSWDFRLEATGDFPTPRDMMNNNDRIHVRYMDDQMARMLRQEFTPNSSWFAPAFSNEVWVVECDPQNRRRTKGRRLLHGGYHQGPVEYMVAKQSNSLRGRNEGLMEHFEKNYQQDEQKQVEQANTSFLEDGESLPAGIFNLDSCREMNPLSKQTERDAWDRLCNEMPLTATYTERIVALAQDECQQKGNPFGATRQWIEEMKMTDEVVTFECFHLPDVKDV